MNQNKLETIANLFEGKEIRSIWDSEKVQTFFAQITNRCCINNFRYH